MAYAAALLLGLAAIWSAWAPRALDPYWLGAGAAGVGVAFVLALLMRSADAEAAPYARAPAALLRGARTIAGSGAGLARRVAAGDPMLHPALLRLKTGGSDDAARLAFVGAATRAGGLVVDVEEESLLVHVLAEGETSEAALLQLMPGAAP